MKHHKISETLLVCIFLFAHLVQVCQAKLPDAPQPRSRQEIENVLATALKLKSTTENKPLTVVLVADKKDHGPHEHDYPLWQKRWQTLLSGGNLGQTNLYGPPQENSGSQSDIGPITILTAKGWPDKEKLALADVVVVFCYIQWNELKYNQLKEHLNRGGGLVLIHSATWTKPGPSEKVAKLTGCGGFTQYRHGPIKLKIVDRIHPICLGLPKEIKFLDESYWPPTPNMNDSKMHILATSDEKISKNSSEIQSQPMFWTYEHGKGRVFGCVLGHYTWTFDDPYFRLLLLRGIAWSAKQPPYRLDTLAIRGILLKD